MLDRLAVKLNRIHYLPNRIQFAWV
jgi:hypothetical protein